jgi:hypothetical protein
MHQVLINSSQDRLYSFRYLRLHPDLRHSRARRKILGHALPQNSLFPDAIS